MPTKRSISQMRYDREKTKYYGMKLNCRTDADIIAWLEKQGGYQTYIKDVIRRDMAGHVDAVQRRGDD